MGKYLDLVRSAPLPEPALIDRALANPAITPLPRPTKRPEPTFTPAELINALDVRLDPNATETVLVWKDLDCAELRTALAQAGVGAWKVAYHSMVPSLDVTPRRAPMRLAKEDLQAFYERAVAVWRERFEKAFTARASAPKPSPL